MIFVSQPKLNFVHTHQAKLSKLPQPSKPALMINALRTFRSMMLLLVMTLLTQVGWGQSTITITNSSIGGSAVLGSNNYGSGAERTWTQSSINFGGKAITCNANNAPSGSTACQYIQAQASNGVIYNTSALPGRIISIRFIGASSVASSLYGGTSRLVNTTSADYTVSGTQIGTAQTSTDYTWTTAAGDNYTFFCIKRGSSAQYFSSIVITYQTPPLPVSLLSFSGYKDGTRNQLRWVTSSESNNRGFEVERSADGRTYQSIGFVNSIAVGGNSQSQLRYSFTDITPGGTMQYYRLKQSDIDGRSTLSNILLIQGEKPTALEIASVFPNPSSGLVTVLLNAPENGNVNIRLLDMAGRILETRSVNVLMGNNSIPFNLTKRAKGQYLISVGEKTIRVIRE